MNIDKITNVVQNRISNSVKNEIVANNTIIKYFPIIFMSGVLSHVTSYFFLTNIIKIRDGLKGIFYHAFLFIVFYTVYFFLIVLINRKNRIHRSMKSILGVWMSSLFLWLFISPWLIMFIAKLLNN